MAVQQNKKSPSRRGMRRAAGARPETPAVSTDKTRGDRHLRHHIAPNGFYRGREIIAPDSDQGDSGE